ncbi:MAG TPA: TonB-dependent receptor [Sphingomicrobium sp.]|nr:TonB-dependent receptor [Sphingomicrobium sp.]
MNDLALVRRHALRSGASLLVLAWLGTSVPAYSQANNANVQAQSTDAGAPGSNANGVPKTKDENNTIIVTGVRRALATAQTLKKNAPTVVDSVTATDIGAFPDQSAAGALQRVPGISVNRLQSADDSTHPSGEPTQVLVRGLPFVRTEFNGRDSFSADSARGLQFNDVSPELLSGIDAYKNNTADMVEGGIAGTVNLRTRLPFDQSGLVVAANVKFDHGDRSGKWTPEFSGLVSDTWDTEAGRFGLLADFAWSHVITRTESVIMDKIDTYCSAGATDANGHAIINNGTIPCTANPFGGSGWAFAPDGIRYSQVDYDRKRHGLALAGQYENPTGNVRANIQYLDSEYHNAWIEHASHAILDGTYFGTPAFDPRSGSLFSGSSGLTFGSNGMLTGGVLTQPHGSWLNSWSPNLQDDINTGSAIPGIPFVNDCAIAGMCSTYQDGLYFQNESRDFDHQEGTKDLSGNIQWDVTPQLHANFDAQHISASTFNNDILVATGSIANYQYSTNSDGTPEITLLPGSNVNYAAGGLANPHNYWIPFIQGHVEDNNAHENAFRGDLKYDFPAESWLESLKVGVRYADRNQTVRYSTFNWTPIAASWNCNGAGFNADNTQPNPAAACDSNFKGYGANIFGPYSFGNFYNGSVYPNGSLVFVNNSALTNYNQLMAGLTGAATNSPIAPGYVPICDRPGTTDCFLPSEVMQLEERTKAAYAMLNFGGDDRTILGGISVVGNIGVRLVRTTEIGIGSVGFPTSDALNTLPACGTPLGPDQVVNPSCYVTPALLAFASGGGTPNSYETSFTKWLPSFNARFGIDQHDFVRIAYSKAISRPDIGLLRNFVQINAPVINTSPDSPYVVYNSPGAAHIPANVTGYNFVFQANAGNVGLKPISADQFDVSFERYMGTTSSFTIDGFYKRLTNLIAYGQSFRSFTNNGSSQVVQVNGPINASGVGKLYGLEANYQTFFTFLPGLLSGLGVQLNYTYVHQSGINNSNVIDATSGGDVGAVGIGQPALGGSGNVIDSHQLAGVSKHTINAVGLYEKGPLAIRLAYNWRSRYLTQNLDCCIGLPVFQKAAGFMDGSIRYSLTRWAELSIEGTNLLGTTTVYQQEIFGDSPQTPGAKPVYMDSAWSRVDRSIQLGIRVKF